MAYSDASADRNRTRPVVVRLPDPFESAFRDHSRLPTPSQLTGEARTVILSLNLVSVPPHDEKTSTTTR